jgi:hypothetical protein
VANDQFANAEQAASGQTTRAQCLEASDGLNADSAASCGKSANSGFCTRDRAEPVFVIIYLVRFASCERRETSTRRS